MRQMSRLLKKIIFSQIDQVTGGHLFVPSGPKWGFSQLLPQFSHLTPEQGKWRDRKDGLLSAHVSYINSQVSSLPLTYHLRSLISTAPRKVSYLYLDEQNIIQFLFSIQQSHWESFFVISILRNCGVLKNAKSP